MPQPIRTRNALVQIVQPINGVPDYAPAYRTTDPAKRQPMARRVSTGSHAILASAIVLMLSLIALALLG